MAVHGTCEWVKELLIWTWAFGSRCFSLPLLPHCLTGFVLKQLLRLSLYSEPCRQCRMYLYAIGLQTQVFKDYKESAFIELYVRPILQRHFTFSKLFNFL